MITLSFAEMYPEMATLAEIAEAVGVSTITVSRVLNGRAQYRRPTFARRAERIRAVAAEMGYRANTAAQSMRSKRYGSVALLLSTVHSRSLLPPALLDGILAALTPRNLTLTLSPVPDERLADPEYVPRMLRTWSSDGLLINYNAEIPASLEERVARSAAPTVWINSRHAANCVYLDDFGASRAVAERLLAAGHRRIAYANYMAPNNVPHQHYSGDERYAGYAAAMRAAGLAPRRLDCERALDSGERVAHSLEWLRAADAPTAVVCYGYRTADSIVRAVHQAGRFLPPSVFAFGDELPYAEPSEWERIQIPMRAMGEAATQMLLELVETPSSAIPPLVLPMILPADGAFRPPSRRSALPSPPTRNCRGNE